MMNRTTMRHLAVPIGVLGLTVAAWPQASVHPLLGHAGFAVGADLRALALADLEADGVPEIVTVLGNARKVVVYRGDGHELASLDLAFKPGQVAALHADGDGRLDVVVTAATTGEIEVLLGAGDGTLTPLLSFASDAQASTLAVGDLDGDGRDDLLFALPATSSLAVRLVARLGAGDGTFGAAITSPLPAGTSVANVRPVLVDLDEDSLLDVALGTSTALVTARGDGAGGFVPAATIPTGTGSLFGLTAAELTGDGRVDLVGALVIPPTFSSTCTPVSFAGNGTLQPDSGVPLVPGVPCQGAANGVVLVDDFTADGVLDLHVIGAGVAFAARGLGAGAFEPRPLSASGSGVLDGTPWACAADVDGDGVVELVVPRRDVDVSTSAPFRMHLVRFPPDGHDGTRSLPAGHISVSNTPKPSLAADLNGDGIDDPMVVTHTLSLDFHDAWISQPDDSFATVPTYATALSSVRVLADVTGDGTIDLVNLRTNMPAGNVPGIQVHEGDGAGGFSFVLESSLDLIDEVLDLGDIDGDGDLDLVAGSTAFDGGFQPALGPAFAVLPRTPTNLDDLVLGDFDLDGVLDLVTVNRFAATASLRNGDGLGGFGAPVTTQVASADFVVAADRDADGRLDAIVVGEDITILEDDGAGLVVRESYPLDFVATGALVDDLDHDGLPDVVAWRTATAFLPGAGGPPAIDAATFADYDGIVAGEFGGALGRELLCVSSLPFFIFADRRVELRSFRPTRPWRGLGDAFGGDGERPRLAARGGRLTGDDVHLWVSRGTPGGTAFLVLGARALDVPCKGGVLVPSPDVVLALPLDVAGSLALTFAWPSALWGFASFWQVWTPDASQPSGFRASNALEAEAP